MRKPVAIIAAFLLLAGGVWAFAGQAKADWETGSPPDAGRASAHRPIAIDPATLQFAPVPNGIPCATAAAVEGDASQGPAVLMFKFTSGCRVPWHWHTPNERVSFVSGSGQFEMKGEKPLPLRPGSYALLPGRHIHRMTCFSDCLLFAAADGVFDIHWVDATGKEIPLDEATTADSAAPGQ